VHCNSGDKVNEYIRGHVIDECCSDILRLKLVEKEFSLSHVVDFVRNSEWSTMQVAAMESADLAVQTVFRWTVYKKQHK
jgi:hypothetical protein